MKKFALNDEEMQSLKTSLLAFVKRVAFQGTDSTGEAEAFFSIVNLLLDNPVALELDLDEQTKTGYVYFGECGCSPCFARLW